MIKPQATIEVYRDARGEWRARLRHKNQNIIWVTSEGYKNKCGVLAAIRYIDKRIPAILPEGFVRQKHGSNNNK